MARKMLPSCANVCRGGGGLDANAIVFFFLLKRLVAIVLGRADEERRARARAQDRSNMCLKFEPS
jgi:hypothetical protein